MNEYFVKIKKFGVFYRDKDEMLIQTMDEKKSTIVVTSSGIKAYHLLKKEMSCKDEDCKSLLIGKQKKHTELCGCDFELLDIHQI